VLFVLADFTSLDITFGAASRLKGSMIKGPVDSRFSKAISLDLDRTRAEPSSSASGLSRAPTKSKLLRSFGERKG